MIWRASQRQRDVSDLNRRHELFRHGDFAKTAIYYRICPHQKKTLTLRPIHLTASQFRIPSQ
jgi:hypothetical protein